MLRAAFVALAIVAHFAAAVHIVEDPPPAAEPDIPPADPKPDQAPTPAKEDGKDNAAGTAEGAPPKEQQPRDNKAGATKGKTTANPEAKAKAEPAAGEDAPNKEAKAAEEEAKEANTQADAAGAVEVRIPVNVVSEVSTEVRAVEVVKNTQDLWKCPDGGVDWNVKTISDADAQKLEDQFSVFAKDPGLELVAVADALALQLLTRIPFQRITLLCAPKDVQKKILTLGQSKLKQSSKVNFFQSMPEVDSGGRIVIAYLGSDKKRWEDEKVSERIAKAGLPEIEYAPKQTNRALFNSLKTRIGAPLILPITGPQLWSKGENGLEWLYETHIYWQFRANELVDGTVLEIIPERKSVRTRFEKESKRPMADGILGLFDCKWEEHVRLPCQPNNRFAASVFAKDFMRAPPNALKQFDTLVLHLLAGESESDFGEKGFRSALKTALTINPHRIVVSEFGMDHDDCKDKGSCYTQDSLAKLVQSEVDESDNKFTVKKAGVTPGQGKKHRHVWVTIESSDNVLSGRPLVRQMLNTKTVDPNSAESRANKSNIGVYGHWEHSDHGMPILWGPTDNIPRVEGLLKDGIKKIPKMETVMVVAGGLSSVWMLNALSEPPRQMVFFDLARPQVLYLRCMLELLVMSNTRLAFLNRVFGRQLSKQMSVLRPEATVAMAMGKIPLDKHMIDTTKAALSKESAAFYTEFIMENIVNVTGKAVRRLYPAWPLNPTSGAAEGVIDLGGHLGDMYGGAGDGKGDKRNVDRVGSFFYDQAGFMMTEERYQRTVTMIKATPDLLVTEMDLATTTPADLKRLGINFGGGVALYVSNLHHFVKGGMATLERRLNTLLPKKVNKGSSKKVVACIVASMEKEPALHMSEVTAGTAKRYIVGRPQGSPLCGGAMEKSKGK